MIARSIILLSLSSPPFARLAGFHRFIERHAPVQRSPHAAQQQQQQQQEPISVWQDGSSCITGSSNANALLGGSSNSVTRNERAGRADTAAARF